MEWRASGECPHDIPSNPDRTYRDEGWLSWADWLGYGKGKPARSTNISVTISGRHLSPAGRPPLAYLRGARLSSSH
eukprot:7080238-Pyramimonas_sp.AAC.1